MYAYIYVYTLGHVHVYMYIYMYICTVEALNKDKHAFSKDVFCPCALYRLHPA